jgi:hypothetical protein
LDYGSNNMRKLFVFAVLLVSATGLAVAQDARGRIVGIVTDASGAVVPGAAVTATHLEMNTRASSKSNDAGNYELPYLLPGVYRVVVELEGFKRYQREPIEVRVGDAITLNVPLELGAVSDTVSVTAEAPMLESTSASISMVIDRRMLEDLPMAGGSITYLARLTPGVTSGQAPGHNWLPSAVDVLSNIAVSGTENGASEFSLDGIPNMTRNRISFSPPADMVQEFRVEAVNYDAGQGHSSGASINMSLKAGTNRLNGTALWEFAPSPWQSTDFFSNKRLYDLSTGPVTPEKREAMIAPRKVHRYSGTAGGPVYIPKVYDGRSRTFWTYGFQGFNRRNPANANYTVPTDAQRAGDFSALLGVGPIYQLYDPATTRPAAGGRFARDPLPGNIVPASRIDPMAKTLLSFYPSPTTPGTADGRNNFQLSETNSNDFRQHMSRIDHNISDRHRLFGRFTHSWLNFYRGTIFPNESRGLDRYRKQRGVGLDDVYVFSPTLLLNIKYGFSRFLESDWPMSRGFDLSSFGWPSSLLSQLDSQVTAFPNIAPEGFAPLGESTNNQLITNYHTFSGTVSQIRGNHSVRWGAEYRVMREHNYNWGNAAPSIAFASAWTRGPLDNAAAAPIGQGLASLLFGLPTGGGIDNNASWAVQSTFTGLFVQDDWKLTRTLTINLGLRWEYDSPITERYDRAASTYDFQTASPIQPAAAAAYAQSPIAEVPAAQFRTIGGLTFAGQDGRPRGAFQTPRNAFAPRFGFAWQAAPKMVVRGGYGIFRNPLGASMERIIQPGFSVRTNLIPSIDSGQTFQATLRNPFPDGVQRPAPVDISTFVGRGISFMPVSRPSPYQQRWSLSIQRELPGRMLGEVSYVGNRGTRLGVNRQFDAIPQQYMSTSPVRDQAVINYMSAQVNNPFFGMPAFAGSGLTGRTVGRGQLVRPFPHFTSLTAPDPVGYSWYHSLQSRFEKRFSRGFTFNATYTWSKLMEATGFLNDTDPTPHEMISDSDRPHRFTLSGVWELPVGRGRHFGGGMHRALDLVIGGWQAQAIYQAQSGQALSWGNIFYHGDVKDIVLPRDQRTLDRWFNTDAPFVRAAAAQPSWNIRTFPMYLTGVRGPGDNYWDMSLAKVIQVTEGLRLQLRTNWEGAMNTPQFSNPNTAVTNTLFGAITATKGEARRVYAGLKLMF